MAILKWGLDLLNKGEEEGVSSLVKIRERETFVVSRVKEHEKGECFGLAISRVKKNAHRARLIGNEKKSVGGREREGRSEKKQLLLDRRGKKERKKEDLVLAVDLLQLTDIMSA